jgi:hypothetical protein
MWSSWSLLAVVVEIMVVLVLVACLLGFLV